MGANPVTLDELLATLQAARSKSKHGGDTCVYFSFPNIEYVPCGGAVVEQDSDGALILLKN